MARAGRPKGQAKTGGRQKGVRNRASVEREKAVAESGVTPLDFMLSIMRGTPPAGSGPAEQIAFSAMRFEAAKAAAPYVHPKLANIEHTGDGGGPVVVSLSGADVKIATG